MGRLPTAGRPLPTPWRRLVRRPLASCMARSRTRWFVRRVLSDRLTVLLVTTTLALGGAAVLPKVVARPPALTIESPPITVSIEGLVASPGVYELDFGARVADLVAAAGGLVAGAARSLVPLAAPLTDGQVVQVPSGYSPAGAPLVNVNSASLGALEGLPGVGPVMAERLTQYRPYASIDDLLRVPGIGPRTLERLRPLVGL